MRRGGGVCDVWSSMFLELFTTRGRHLLSNGGHNMAGIDLRGKATFCFFFPLQKSEMIRNVLVCKNAYSLHSELCHLGL